MFYRDSESVSTHWLTGFQFRIHVLAIYTSLASPICFSTRSIGRIMTRTQESGPRRKMIKYNLIGYWMSSSTFPSALYHSRCSEIYTTHNSPPRAASLTTWFTIFITSFLGERLFAPVPARVFTSITSWLFEVLKPAERPRQRQTISISIYCIIQGF